jgi:hypothetical protein
VLNYEILNPAYWYRISQQLAFDMVYTTLIKAYAFRDLGHFTSLEIVSP